MPSVFQRRGRDKQQAEIVLLCNPRAGGRWRELAAILDSDEARHVRRIVTDSVEDLGPALSELGREVKLLCIYGGDGTIQRVLDRLSPSKQKDLHLALIGGGTMNVTARWCGFTRSPAHNFRTVVNAYRSGNLLLREVPLLRVQRGARVCCGFTFGMGPIIRVLDAYERGRKGKRAALGIALRSMAAAWLRYPADFLPLLEEMEAEVELDGEKLDHDRFSAVFANVTGQINPGVAPFVDERTRDSFFCAAYAVKARELVLALPFLARGVLPVDLQLLMRPVSLLRSNGERRENGQRALPVDPRYVNRTARRMTIRTRERLYTVDGEILSGDEETVEVGIGVTLKLAVSPTAAVRPGLRRAADVVGVLDT